ncbi:MAG TPA: cytochrome c peroxidase [Cyclobacteriaceae bacterium]|nr:cytochrome c peroxidase [Cyclobacteriaceae bacterium]
MTILSLVFQACQTDESNPPQPTPYEFPELYGFPTSLNIPELNPTTVEGVKLGRYLFYDGRLSGRDHTDSLMSCATCHIQSKGFECGPDHPEFKGFPFGLPTNEFPNGKRTQHVMLPLLNTVFNSKGYLWNGWVEAGNPAEGIAGYGFMGDPFLDFRFLESVVWMAITAEDEMAGSVDKTVEMVSSIPLYKSLFRDAFGTEEINIERISKAIAQFVRTLIAYRFKFYKYVIHEAELTPSELSGSELFYNETADCFHCHGGSLMMTTTDYYNNAKDSAYDKNDDRYSVTGNRYEKGAFRAPSLINCEINGPYMHDGRFKTLDEVIDFYSEGLKYSDYVSPLMKFVQYGGVHLTTEQKADLKAFLLTLTDHELLTDPAYSCPAELGEWGIRYEGP